AAEDAPAGGIDRLLAKIPASIGGYGFAMPAASHRLSPQPGEAAIPMTAARPRPALPAGVPLSGPGSAAHAAEVSGPGIHALSATSPVVDPLTICARGAQCGETRIGWL